MVTWQFKFGQFKFLLNSSSGHMSKYTLKFKKIKTCHSEEINKACNSKKKLKMKILKEILHNF